MGQDGDDEQKVVRKRRRKDDAAVTPAMVETGNAFLDQGAEPKPERKIDLSPQPPGAELAKEMMKSAAEKDAEAHANRIAAARFDFESANAAEESPMRDDLVRIVEQTWFEGDADKLYEEIESSWELGDDRTNPGALTKRLDEAHVRWRKAHRLLVTFRRERAAWERRNAQLFGAMYNAAERTLQKEKDAKARNKAITNEDVRMMAATIFGDEWSKQEDKRDKMKETEKDLENIVEVARQSVSSIQSILAVRR